MFFFIGLCAGSLLNVCIDRIPINQSLLKAPFCPYCGARIKAADRIPVFSYIKLRGVCRNCGSHQSVRYPLVELLTGSIWLMTAIRYGFTFETIALVYLFSILIAAALIDVEHMIIPNGLVLSALAGGMAVFLCHILYRPFGLYGSALWYAPFIGMVSASGILFLVAIAGFLIYKDDGAMGMGDVKLFLPIGMFLGWRLALLALIIAVLIGGVVSVILLIFKIKDRKSAIPFGPFIVAASFIAGLFGLQLL